MSKPCRIGILGHFCFEKELFNGQTVKTKMFTSALETELGKSAVVKIDTHGGIKALPKVCLNVLKAMVTCRAVVMLPAHNGVKVFTPILVILGKFFRRRIYYVVIGGWLPEMTACKKWLAFLLKKFDGIYVETSSMEKALSKQGFNNVLMMPNFKDLAILDAKELVYTTKEPFPFCTFSRVMKEKGIEDAVTAITQLNMQAGRTVATLDIYGQIDSNYTERFNRLRQNCPPFIEYKGVVAPNESVPVLKNYFALLFPTYYQGEGFAGTLLDAMAAGVPVIASDWKYNKEIVKDGKTGVLIHSNLLTEIEQVLAQPDQFNRLKPFCLQEAQNYTPKTVITPVVTFITKQVSGKL